MVTVFMATKAAWVLLVSKLMEPSMFDLLGWIATAIFAASYLLKSPSALRRCQAVAAVLWVIYGIFIRAAPVVGANLIVAAMALGSTWRLRNNGRKDLDGPSTSP
jgi:hypothetical protein